MDPNEEYLPGFERIQDPHLEQKMESRTNLIVFGIVLLAVLPFLIWGHWFMRTPSEKHFLIGIPLTDFKSLEPVEGIGAQRIPSGNQTEFMLGAEEDSDLLINGLPKSRVFVNRSFFIILWGPWDDNSCDLLRQIWEPLQNAQKNKQFQVIPIAYFPHASEPVKWYEMSQEERQMFLNQKEEEKKRLGQYVRQSFQNGFNFPTVWWDPINHFRQDLIEQSIELEQTHEDLRGISFPTIIFVEKGIITKVWTSNSPEDLAEIEETLKIVALSAQTGGSGKAPEPVPASAKNP